MRGKKPKPIRCDFCIKPKIDDCALCHKGVCEEHGKPIQLKFLWHLCPECQKLPEERVKEMDDDLAESEEGGKLEC